MSELDKELDDLANSLTYQMSLGSRELFHSNIWAWLMKFDQRFINVFFSEYDEKNYTIVDGKIYREKDNFDISFSVSHNDDNKEREIFIIENKIKSFITVDQLSKYTEKIKKSNGEKPIHAIYTGIKDSLSEEQRKKITGANWKFLSYRDIGSRIKDAVSTLINELSVDEKKNSKKLDQCKLIDAYADSIISMAHVLSDTLDNSGTLYTYETDQAIMDKLEDLRLLDVYKKMKVSHFSKYFRENYFDHIETPEGYKLDSWCGFSDKQPIFDIRFKRTVLVPSTKTDKKGKPIEKSIFEIGIQIQGNQYRFACLTMKENKKDGEGQKNNFFKEIVEHSDPKWFDEEINDNCPIENCAHGVRLHKPKIKGLRYCSYEDKAADGYIFIYQYSVVKDVIAGEVETTYENLANRICEDLNDAKKVIKSLHVAHLHLPEWVQTNNQKEP